MKKTAVSVIRNLTLRSRAAWALGHRLAPSPKGVRLNPSHAPVGMLDVERITRVSEPISTIVSRPASKAQV